MLWLFAVNPLSMLMKEDSFLPQHGNIPAKYNNICLSVIAAPKIVQELAVWAPTQKFRSVASLVATERIVLLSKRRVFHLVKPGRQK